MISLYIIHNFVGTHDIQNVSRNATHLKVTFVGNSTAKGALIILVSNGTCSYDYITAEKVDSESILDFKISDEDLQSFQSDPAVLVFDIKTNGLLKNVTELRPSFQLVNDGQPCLTTDVTCDSQASCNHSKWLYHALPFFQNTTIGLSLWTPNAPACYNYTFQHIHAWCMYLLVKYCMCI